MHRSNKRDVYKVHLISQFFEELCIPIPYKYSACICINAT